MGHLDDAMACYERALRANPNSIPAMSGMSSVLRAREDFVKAAEYLNAILKLDDRNGEAWGSLGAYTAQHLAYGWWVHTRLMLTGSAQGIAIS